MAEIAEMAEGLDARHLLTGRQSYRLEVPGSISAKGLSVVSFKARERLGMPYRVTVQLTHAEDLDRSDYVNRDATFLIDADGSEPRKFAGWISAFSKISQTRDGCTYEIVLVPLVARLGLTRRSRVFQQKTAPQIIETILRGHDLNGHHFSFKTRRQYREHRFRLQYELSDWDYIRLLMEQEGLYCYFMPGTFGDIVVFADDIDHYIYQPQRVVPYRETAGLESGVEAIHSIKTHATAVPESFSAADYNPDSSWERFKAQANVARKDKTTYGESCVYGTHHLDHAGARWEAQLRHEAAIAGQVVYWGESTVLELRPARILRMDQALPDAPDGQVVIEVVHSGARDQAYRNTYSAIPSNRRFRLPIDESRWPRIAGTLSGRITSPGRYKYAYLTQDGHYTVRLDLDFDEWPKGGESVPLRLAKPFAGALQTGFHFPLVDGTEVAVAFHDGNPNRPYIAHAMHNSLQSDPVTSRNRWLSRNVIRTQSNNKLRMEDWEGQEGIKLSTEYGGKTQLNLGYLVDRGRKHRGGGFELRTDLKGSVRAAEGLLLSADKQLRAVGAQTDTQAASEQFGRTQAQADRLAAAASVAQADIADLKTENQWLKQELESLKGAVLALSAPNGIGLATPDRVMVSAGKDVSMSASGGCHVHAMKRFTVVAGERISMFAHKLGVKLFAAKGAVQIQAQSDAMSLASEQDMTIQSANGRVVIEASKELVLQCGGSYLRMTATGIEDGTRGDRTWKAVAFCKEGPSSLPGDLQVLPKPEATQCALRESQSGTPFAKLVL